MKGVQIDYKLKKGMSSRFNQKMFGRISVRRDNGSTYAYYIPGVLDNIPHYRIFDGRVFIGTTGPVDFGPILGFCEKFDTATVEKTDSDILLKTGRQRWMFHSKERGLKIGWR